MKKGKCGQADLCTILLCEYLLVSFLELPMLPVRSFHSDFIKRRHVSYVCVVLKKGNRYVT